MDDTTTTRVEDREEEIVLEANKGSYEARSGAGWLMALAAAQRAKLLAQVRDGTYKGRVSPGLLTRAQADLHTPEAGVLANLTRGDAKTPARRTPNTPAKPAAPAETPQQTVDRLLGPTPAKTQPRREYREVMEELLKRMVSNPNGASSMLPLGVLTHDRAAQERLMPTLVPVVERLARTVTTSGVVLSESAPAADAMGWLAELDSVYSAFDVRMVPDGEGSVLVTWGDTPPEAEYLGEAGQMTETTPTQNNIRIEPLTAGVYLRETSALRHTSQLLDVFTDGMEALLREKVLRAILCGKFVGPAFAEDATPANLPTGLLPASISTANPVTGYGAADSDLMRSDFLNLEHEVVKTKVPGRPVWLMSQALAEVAANTAVNGAGSSRFLLDDGGVVGVRGRVPAYVLQNMGQAGLTQPGICLSPSTFALRMWSNIEVRVFDNPSVALQEIGLIAHYNGVLRHPGLARVLVQG